MCYSWSYGYIGLIFTVSVPSSLLCVWVTQSCPTLCDPMDCSPPGSSAHGILQARILEWVAVSFSSVNFSSSNLFAKLCPTLATPQTIACHVPLSMAFSRQEHWSGWPFPSPPSSFTWMKFLSLFFFFLFKMVLLLYLDDKKVRHNFLLSGIVFFRWSVGSAQWLFHGECWPVWLCSPLLTCGLAPIHAYCPCILINNSVRWCHC